MIKLICLAIIIFCTGMLVGLFYNETLAEKGERTMVWIPKEPKYKPKPPKPNNTPTNTPTNTPMNRGEAIKVLRLMEYKYLIRTGSIFDTALGMAIEALQTPPITQRSMYQAGYRQGREEARKRERSEE